MHNAIVKQESEAEAELDLLASPVAAGLFDIMLRHKVLAKASPAELAERLHCDEVTVFKLMCSTEFNDLLDKAKLELARNKFAREGWEAWYDAVDQAEGKDKAWSLDKLRIALQPKSKEPLVQINIGSKYISEIDPQKTIEIKARSFPGLTDEDDQG